MSRAVLPPPVRVPERKQSAGERDELVQRVRFEIAEDERVAAWLDDEREPVEA